LGVKCVSLYREFGRGRHTLKSLPQVSVWTQMAAAHCTSFLWAALNFVEISLSTHVGRPNPKDSTRPLYTQPEHFSLPGYSGWNGFPHSTQALRSSQPGTLSAQLTQNGPPGIWTMKLDSLLQTAQFLYSDIGPLQFLRRLIVCSGHSHS